MCYLCLCPECYPCVCALPPRPPSQRSAGRATAGGREQRLAARPPARFNSLRNQQTVNQNNSHRVTLLLAQRSFLSGNSYFWPTTTNAWMTERCGGVLLVFSHLIVAAVCVSNDGAIPPSTDSRTSYSTCGTRAHL